MFTRRIALASFFVFMLTVLGGGLTATSAHAESSAEMFVAGLADEAIQALTAKDVERSDRIIRFRKLLKANFNVPLIGKWVLGRSWRKASDEEKQDYLGLYENYIVLTYIERFDQYSGEKLEVVKSVAGPGNDFLVYSTLNRPTGGDAIRVDWRVRATADVYKIIDVYVEGISMSQSQRKEFASVMKNKGGKVSGLNDMLRAKNAELDK